jgi:hypothetical protein
MDGAPTYYAVAGKWKKSESKMNEAVFKLNALQKKRALWRKKRPMLSQ